MEYNPDYSRIQKEKGRKCRHDTEGDASPLLYSLKIPNVHFLVCPRKPPMHCICKKFLKQLRLNSTEALVITSWMVRMTHELNYGVQQDSDGFLGFFEILKRLRRSETLQTWPNMNSYMIKICMHWHICGNGCACCSAQSHTRKILYKWVSIS